MNSNLEIPKTYIIQRYWMYCMWYKNVFLCTHDDTYLFTQESLQHHTPTTIYVLKPIFLVLHLQVQILNWQGWWWQKNYTFNIHCKSYVAFQLKQNKTFIAQKVSFAKDVSNNYIYTHTYKYIYTCKIHTLTYIYEHIHTHMRMCCWLQLTIMKIWYSL